MFWISPSLFSTVSEMPILPTAKATSFTFPIKRPCASITCIETSASLVSGLSVLSIWLHSPLVSIVLSDLKNFRSLFSFWLFGKELAKLFINT